MPYTNPWSTTIPPGTADANTLDTIIQQVRLDIAQRINTMIGSSGSMSNDPVIDSTNALDLTALTTLTNSKTTLVGLTTGSLIKATSAGTVGNASVTDATLAAMATATVVSTNTFLPINFSLGSTPGTYLITIGYSSPGGNATISFSFISPAVGTFPNSSYDVTTGVKSTMTFLFITTVGGGALSITQNSNVGNPTIIIKRLL